jgi:hypothetical protein
VYEKRTNALTAFVLLLLAYKGFFIMSEANNKKARTGAGVVLLLYIKIVPI